MKKKETRNLSRIQTKSKNKELETPDKGKFLRLVQMSKVFILNNNSKTAKEQRTESVTRSEQFTAGIKGKSLATSITPDKLPKIQLSKIAGFQEKFTLRLQQLKSAQKVNGIALCIDLLDLVIKEDFIFCNFLQKIKEELAQLQSFHTAGTISNTFNQRNPAYQSQMTHFMVSERQESHKDRTSLITEAPLGHQLSASFINSNFDALKDHQFLIQAQENFKNFQALKKIPNSTNDELRTFESIESNANTQSNKDLKTRLTLQQSLQIQSLEFEIKKLKLNELKYQHLLTALKNRGYPVDEVYEFDVHQRAEPETHLKPINFEGVSLTSDESSEDN